MKQNVKNLINFIKTIAKYFLMFYNITYKLYKMRPRKESNG